ncbi:hypothetical protein RB614_13510 [Phytohabitans sp. ZYX-F-186]|uniref:Uncharacterized protein n=1 Tax=Phytohabitans maris TaxID=3071409 RepID=A0ABU0ZEP9_9ACTN|nr:hypothetical protein [Phytohabitans sp. ZYX-F-186]MDQ7905536.1 hypothetical protein [Phytohabitans sp. ZYX-F-186]
MKPQPRRVQGEASWRGSSRSALSGVPFIDVVGAAALPAAPPGGRLIMPRTGASVGVL